MKAPELKTQRLRLRGFRASDLDAFAATAADAEVMRFIGTGVTLTRAEAWRSMAFFLGHWDLRGYGMWAIERKGSGEFLGRAGFHDPEGWPGFELGWLLGREHWGHGYALEAARAALGYARDALGRERVISLIRPGNARSIKLAATLGASFKEEIDLLGGKILVYETRT